MSEDLERKLFELMNQYKQPISDEGASLVDYDFSLENFFERVGEITDFIILSEELLDPKFGSSRLRLLKKRLKNILPHIELNLINKLINEAASNSFINYPTYLILEKTSLTKKVSIGLLTTIGAELYREQNPEKFYVVPDGLDYVGIGAEGVKIKARKVGKYCGCKAEDSEFEVYRAGYNFLSNASNCIGRVEIVGDWACFKARWTTIRTKKADTEFLESSSRCKGFVEEWAGKAGHKSFKTYINGIEVGPEGLSMEDYLKFKG